MYLCVKGYQAMTERVVMPCQRVVMYLCGRGYHVDREWSCICVFGVPSHDREWSCICVLGGTKP